MLATIKAGNDQQVGPNQQKEVTNFTQEEVKEGEDSEMTLEGDTEETDEATMVAQQIQLAEFALSSVRVSNEIVLNSFDQKFLANPGHLFNCQLPPAYRLFKTFNYTNIFDCLDILPSGDEISPSRYLWEGCRSSRILYIKKYKEKFHRLPKSN